MRNFSFLMLILMFFSCKKAEERTCLKSSGEKTSIGIDLPEFSKVKLLKKLKYQLVQDDSTYMVIYGGKNLLSFVKWKINDSDELEISNTNKCDFLRDLKSSILVEIHFKNLTDIIYNGSEKLSNEGVLNFNNLYLLLLDCSGQVELRLNANTLKCENSEGFSDYTLHGTSVNAEFGIRANAYADCSDFLVTNEINFNNKSVGDLKLNANNCKLSGFIAGKGNVYYTGLPSLIDVQTLSSGKLIPY